MRGLNESEKTGQVLFVLGVLLFKIFMVGPVFGGNQNRTEAGGGKSEYVAEIRQNYIDGVSSEIILANIDKYLARYSEDSTDIQIGRLYFYKSRVLSINNDTACREFFKKADQQLVKFKGNSAYLVVLYSEWGAFESDNLNSELGLKLFHKGLKVDGESDFVQQSRADVYHNLGIVNRRIGKSKEALYYAQHALDIYSQYQDTVNFYHVFIFSAKLYSDLDQPAKSNEMLLEGLKQIESLSFVRPEYLLVIYGNFIFNCFKLKQYDEFNEYLQKYYRLSKDSQIGDGGDIYILKCLEQIAQGNYQQGEIMFQQFEKDISDSPEQQLYHQSGTSIYRYENLLRIGQEEKMIKLCMHNINCLSSQEFEAYINKLNALIASAYIRLGKHREANMILVDLLEYEKAQRKLELNDNIARYQADAKYESLMKEFGRMEKKLLAGQDREFWYWVITTLLSSFVLALSLTLRMIYRQRNYFKKKNFFQNIDHMELVERFRCLLNDKNSSDRSVVQMMELKEEAKKAISKKNHSLASMHHELKTPLNAIVNNADILKCRLNQDENLNLLNIVLSESVKMKRIVKDVLDFSALEAGKKKIVQEILDIRELMGIIQSASYLELEKRGNKFTTIIDPDVPTRLVFYVNELEQVVNNLISNAIKYTQKGNIFIRVKCRPASKMFNGIALDIEIEDSGMGMDANMIAKLFTPFQRKFEDSIKYDSTGLGLVITQKMVQIMGGEIRVNSELNKGSVFTISFDNIQQLKESEAIATVRDIRLGNILFDDLQVLMVFKSNPLIDRLSGQLENMGLRITYINKNIELFELIKIQHFDLIMLDMENSIFNGTDLCKLIKKNKNYKHVPILGFREKAPEYYEIEEESLFMGIYQDDILLSDLCVELCKFLPHQILPEFNEKGKSAAFSLEEKYHPDWIIEFEKRFNPQWNLIRSGNRINEVNNFVIEVSKFLTIHPSHFIQEFINELQGALDNFDVVSIPLILKRFPGLIQKLKEL